MSTAFSFELVSPEALILAGEAEQVVVPGLEGYFTVMANHAPLMTSIKPGIVDVQLDGEMKRLFVRGGFADVSPSGFTLLADIAVELDQMETSDLETQIAEAKEAVTAADSEENITRTKNVLAELEESLLAVKHGQAKAH